MLKRLGWSQLLHGRYFYQLLMLIAGKTLLSLLKPSKVHNVLGSPYNNKVGFQLLYRDKAFSWSNKSYYERALKQLSLARVLSPCEKQYWCCDSTLGSHWAKNMFMLNNLYFLSHSRLSSSN